MSESPRNLSNLIQEIRNDREIGHDKETSNLKVIDNLLGQVSDNLYSTEFHFILELIQNAVDSPRPTNGLNPGVQVQFHLNTQANSLIVANNGAPFSETDIKRLCGVLQERKGPKKIGYKGIGFKSVIRVTHNPQIYSPGCHFEFDKKRYPGYEYAWLIIPHWISSERVPEFVKPDLVTFVLPFREDLAPDDINRLSKEMDELSPELLLFLDNLEKLTIRNEASHHVIDIRKRVNEAGLTIVERAEAEAWETLGRWVVTSYRPEQSITQEARDDYETKRGLKKRREAGEEIANVSDTNLALAFRLDESNNFVAEKEGPIFAFFPVIGQTSGLRFGVQADFLTTASRETLAASSPWNKWLLSNLPDAIAASIEKLKQRSEWHPIIYNALPLETEGQEVFKNIAAKLLPQLRQLPLIVTDLLDDETWILPVEAAWLPSSLRPLLNNADLRQLWPEKRAFVSFRIEGERAEKFLTSRAGLQVELLKKEKFLEFLQNTAWLESKPVAWFGLLFDYLAGSKLDDPQLKTLRALKLVPTLEGLAQANEGIFLPAEADPLSVSYTRFVHPDLLNQIDPKIADFLKELGVQPATPPRLIEKVIIPTLKDKKETLPLEILSEYVAFVKTHYDGLPDTLCGKLYDSMLLQAADGTWQPAPQLSLAYDAQGSQSLAGYLLAGAPLRFLVRLPEKEEREAWFNFYQWLKIETEPPINSLLDALKETVWFADKPPNWFCVLYTYLEPHAKTSLVLRSLSTILVMQTDGSAQLSPPSNQIFFQTDGIDVSQLGGIFAEDKIVFVNPVILLPDTPLSLPFGATPLQAKHFLENLDITELKRHEIVKRLIIKHFEECAAKYKYNDRLLGYTAFVLETFEDQKNKEDSEAWQKFKKVIRLKATDGSWQRPADLYLTKAYSAHDFETLLEGFAGVRFLSREYLNLITNKESSKSEYQKRWHEFMVGLGVCDRLKVTGNPTERKNFYRDFSVKDRDYLKRIMESKIDGNYSDTLRYYEKHRITNHAIMDYLKQIIDKTNSNRLEVLLTLIGDFWKGENGYQKWMSVIYEKKWHGWRKSEDKPSYIKWLLTSNAVLPTKQGLKSKGDPVFRDKPEIRQLVGDEAAYLNFNPKENLKELLADILGVVWEPETVPVWAVQNNLRHLKEINLTTPEQCAAIYKFLAEKEAFEILEKESLVFLPTDAQSWWKPSELFWSDYSSSFGNLRGYVSTQPAYKDFYTTFEKIGINTDQPQPKDWADLLLDLEKEDKQPKDVIWRAYQALEEFWRAEPEEPDWWADFAASVGLLTETNGYYPVSDGLYIPDDPQRYKLFKADVPFIWLRDSFRTIETFLQKLGLRQISDLQWIKEEVKPGPEVEPEKSAKIRQEIIEARPFIRSILIHKHPQEEARFNPQLNLLNPDSNFKVCLVETLEIYLTVTDKPEIKHPLKYNAFYSPQVERLYVFSSRNLDREAIGLGMATMFGEFEETLRSELMQLFLRRSQDDKKRLLDNLRIPLSVVVEPVEPPLPPLDPPVSSPSLESIEIFVSETEADNFESINSELELEQPPENIDSQSAWEPEHKLGEAEVTVKTFIPSGSSRRQRRSSSGVRQRHSPHPNTSPPEVEAENNLSADDKDKIGRMGEELARKGIRDELQEKYPTGQITETVNGFTITLNGQVVVEAHWLTHDEGEQAGYDFSVIENGHTTYYEVKSTITEDKDWFDVSRRQWEFAQEQGDQYVILRVYNVGAKNVKVEKIGNPYRLWEEGELIAYPVRIQI